MSAEAWASVGAIVATLVLVVVPGLVYAWYVLEQMIGDPKSYDHVIAAVHRARNSRPEREGDAATDLLRPRYTQRDRRRAPTTRRHER